MNTVVLVEGHVSRRSKKIRRQYRATEGNSKFKANQEVQNVADGEGRRKPVEQKSPRKGDNATETNLRFYFIKDGAD